MKETALLERNNDDSLIAQSLAIWLLSERIRIVYLRTGFFSLPCRIPWAMGVQFVTEAFFHLENEHPAFSKPSKFTLSGTLQKMAKSHPDGFVEFPVRSESELDANKPEVKYYYRLI